MRTYSVSEFNKEINELLSRVPVCVQGEVSEFNISQNRFVWFKLKDDKSSFNCFMMMFQLKHEIADGMEIKIYGTPGVFQKSGQFRFMVKQIELVGEGALKKQFELLKKKLEQEGLFDESRKRALPVFPQKIGLVTSESAAAFKDVNRVLNNRWAGMEIIFYNTQVQGDAAIGQIIEGLNHLNEHHPDLDAIILTRGGGGMEDLQAFNAEDVARAIFASNIPVVSGVGHERDETIADYVADKRAATPSNAAEILVPHRDDVRFQIEQMEKAMQNELMGNIKNKKELIERFFGSLDMRIDYFKGEIDGHINLLKSYNPGNVLKRGYSITRANNKIVRSVKALKRGRQLETQLADGKIKSKIN